MPPRVELVKLRMLRVLECEVNVDRSEYWLGSELGTDSWGPNLGVAGRDGVSEGSSKVCRDRVLDSGPSGEKVIARSDSTDG